MKLTVERMTYGPDSIAHTPEGKTVFVAGGIAGDVVEATITHKGKTLDHAQVQEILEPSPWRVTAPCPFIDMCGGCPWGAMERTAQLSAKESNVRDTLERIGHFPHEVTERLVQPIRSTNDSWGYRNKIELTPYQTNGRIRLGLHGRDANHIISVKECPLFDAKFPKAISAVVGALSFLNGSRDLGLERVGLRASRRTGALEVALWTPTGSFPRAQVSRVLADALGQKTGIVRVMTKGIRKARRVSSLEILAGPPRWIERIANGTMAVSAPSFFQVNTKAAEILIDLVMGALHPQATDEAMDLYCGAGTFTLPLARVCNYVAAVESYGPAVRDLRHNIEDSGLDNIDPIGGDAVREFPEGDADILVVDPPRAGLASEAIDLIAKTNARDVAYVSCDPATLARDLARFVEQGVYEIVSVTPVDLFPQTFHCETVTHLTRRA